MQHFSFILVLDITFLKSLTESEAQQLPPEKLITLTNKQGKFFTKATSLEDRYDNREKELIDISLSQFAKRITKARKNAKKYENDENVEEIFPRQRM